MVRPADAFSNQGSETVPDPGYDDPSETYCGPENVSDFAVITSMRCSQSIDGHGTMHLSVTAVVAPLPFSLGARQVSSELVVDRNGHVLQSP